MADGTTVDSLQIEIEASSAEAEKRVGALAAALERLKKATTGFSNISNRIRDIGASASERPAAAKNKQRRQALDRATEAVSSSKSIGFSADRISRELSRIDKEIDKNTKKILYLQSRLDGLEETKGIGLPATKSETLSQIKAVEEQLSQYSKVQDLLDRQRRELIRSIERKESGQDITPRVDTSDLDKATKKVGSLDQAAKALDRVKLQLTNELAKAEIQVVKTDGKLADLRRKLDDLSAKATGPIAQDALFSAEDKFSGFSNDAERAKQRVDELRQSLEYLKKYKPDLSMPDIEQEIRATSDELRGLIQSYRESNSAAKLASEEMRSSMAEVNAAVRSTKKIKVKVDTSDLDKATRKAGKLTKVLDSIKRIAFYRTIRSLLKMVTDGFGTGINNLYQYSAIMGTELKPAMDQIATSSLYLKNSLGAMVAPLIQALAPAIDFVVDKFVSLLNIINQVFAALSGSDYYTKAIKQAKEYASATDAAAKSVKNFTIGIDELNIIEPTFGGGGGAALPDYSTMFEEEKIGAPAKKIAEILKGILPYVDKIAAGFAGWMIARSLFSDLGTLQTMLGGIMVGVGVTLLIESIKDILFGDGLTWENILKGGAGGAIAGGGLGLLFAKKLGLSWAQGMLGGAVIGLGISLIAMSVAAQIRDGLNLENALLGMLGGALVGGMAGKSLAFKLGVDKSRGIIGGITAGIGLSLLLSALNDIKENGLNIGNAILTAIGGALAGVGIGWALGGPGGALIGATIGIGVSLIVAWFTDKASKPPTDFMVEMNEVIDRSKASAERATAAIDNLKNSVKNLDSVSVDFAVANRLVDAIFEINEKSVITDAEFATMKTLVGALNGMNIDGLKLSIDETTGRVNEARESVEELILSLEKEAKVEALREILIQSYEDQWQALLDADKAARDYASGIETLGKVQRGEIQLSMQELKALGLSIQESSDAYYANRDAVIELGNAQDMLLDQFVSLQGGVDDIGVSINDYTNGVDENLLRSSSDIEDYVSNSKQSFGELSDGVETAGSEMASSVKGTMVDILTEMTTKWSGIELVFDTTLSGIKTKTGNHFEDIKTNTHRTLGDIQTQAGKDSEEIANKIQGPLENVAKDAKQWGKDICNNLASGMRGAGKDTVIGAANALAKSIRDRLHFSEPDVGPLSDFHTYMPDMLDLMSRGIKDNTYKAVNAASELAGAMSRTLGNIEPVEPKFSNLPSYEMSFSESNLQGREGVSNYSVSPESGTSGNDNSDLINAFYTAAGMIVEAIQNQDNGVYLDGKQIMQSVEKSQRQRGANIMGGGVLY